MEKGQEKRDSAPKMPLAATAGCLVPCQRCQRCQHVSKRAFNSCLFRRLPYSQVSPRKFADPDGALARSARRFHRLRWPGYSPTSDVGDRNRPPTGPRRETSAQKTLKLSVVRPRKVSGPNGPGASESHSSWSKTRILQALAQAPLPTAMPNRNNQLDHRGFKPDSQHNMNDPASILTKFPLLEGFTVHGAQMLLECGEIRDYGTGDLLFGEGEPGAFAMLALTGKLQVFVQRSGHDLVLRDVRPGVILGELAVLCNIPRSASVRAVEKTTVLQWSAENFRRMLLRSNLLSERVLGQSLRTLLEKERSLVDSLMPAQEGGGQNHQG